MNKDTIQLASVEGRHPVDGGPDPSLDGELRELGVTVATTLSYEWGGYKYSNRADAVAAAKRGRDTRRGERP